MDGWILSGYSGRLRDSFMTAVRSNDVRNTRSLISSRPFQEFLYLSRRALPVSTLCPARDSHWRAPARSQRDEKVPESGNWDEKRAAKSCDQRAIIQDVLSYQAGILRDQNRPRGATPEQAIFQQSIACFVGSVE